MDNSILYAGYQYDEETGLYYINARMYDPVTARFLQADTYLGNTSDPLSLNLYTYCLNNPHKYTDPSGHFAITLGGILLAARIVTSLVSGVMSGVSEYKRQVAEGDNYADWKSILFVGGANAALSFATFGIGQGAVAGAGVAAVLKHVGKAVVRDAAIGALTDAGIETARQLITGTKITNLEYDRIAEAGIMGGIVGGGSTIVGSALEGLARTRVVKSAVAKFTGTVKKGAKALKSEFMRMAADNRGYVNLDAFKPNKSTAEVIEDGVDSLKRINVGDSGHHVPAVRKSKGRPFEVSRSDKTRPTIFSKGSDPGYDHWRLHDAERNYIGPRQGAFVGTNDELFDAYRNAYKGLSDIRVDVKSPNGTYTLGTDVTPYQAVDLIQNWLKEQKLY